MGIIDKEDIGIIIVGYVESDDSFNEAQELATKHYKKRNGRRKAGLWICHKLRNNEPIHPSCKLERCFHCGNRIVYDPSLAKNMRKNAEKICRECVLNVDKYSENLSQEDKDFLNGKQGNS